ncbi:MAG TPA: carboxypeptidase-like regulatory domain-containing protein [Thermoanaerobaculia bacterium]|jgi:hypothetical protein
MRRATLLFAALLITVSTRAATVAVRVEPPQSLLAITLRSGDDVRSVAISGGKFIAPDDLPLPWSVGMSRFEPTAFTQADLEAKRPLTLRELGILRGTLQRAKPPARESFAWLLQRAGASQPEERPFAVDATGTFEVRLAAGLYQGAALGATSATRIRSGMVIKAGQPTDVGALACEPTAPVSVRVIDVKRNVALAGARVEWNPPGDILNAELNRTLYGRRWSGTTDRNGVITFPSVGPLPMSIRWRIVASGFATAATVRTQLKEVQRVALPDVRLRPEATILVRTVLPRDEKIFRDAKLGWSTREDERSHRFTRKAVTELRDGETRLRVGDYGLKRITIESATGNLILYRDVDVANELTVVDVAPRSVEIYGRVTRRDEPVPNTIVRATEERDGSVELAETRTNDAGVYRVLVWQSGPVQLYTIPAGGEGLRSGNARMEVDTTNRNSVRADLELPRSGFVLRVIDATTGTPVKAMIWRRFAYAGERAQVGGDESSPDGRLVVTDYPDGKAHLHIQAKGYRARDLEILISENNTEHVIRLEKSRGIRGRVVNTHGVPLRGARVTGGYQNELTMQGHFFTQTDANGRFSFDSAPEPGTMFYVAAARHALGMTTLQSDVDNTIILHPPSAGVATLLPDNAPPKKVYMVMAVPAGGGFIPIGALDDLAEVNGMNAYQLHGSGLDGSVVLPEFLAPGAYELFIAKRGGEPYIYQRVGRINAPLQRNITLSYSSQ